MEFNCNIVSVFNYMRVGNNMAVFVDNKTGATSRVKPADFDLYRHDGRTNSAIDFSYDSTSAGNIIISRRICLGLQPQIGKDDN